MLELIMRVSPALNQVKLGCPGRSPPGPADRRADRRHPAAAAVAGLVVGKLIS